MTATSNMEIRTPDTLREEAAKQFAWSVDFATRRERDVAEARGDEELGMRLLEAALALPEGALLDWGAHLPPELSASEKFNRAFRVLPYLSGARLQLLELEFAHATAGVVSNEAVRALLGGAENFEFNGVTLTPQTVVMQFRRKALG
jgi:hypothetical protein